MLFFSCVKLFHKDVYKTEIYYLGLNTPKLFDKTPDKGISILLATQLKAGIYYDICICNLNR